MRYALTGAAVGVLVAPLLRLEPANLWVTVPVGALVVYLLSCWLFPFTRCPWCKDARRRFDGDGNWRLRNCPLCDDQPYLRLGARLMRRAR